MVLFLIEKSGLSYWCTVYLFYIHPSSLILRSVLHQSIYHDSRQVSVVLYHNIQHIYLYRDLSKEKSTIIFNGRKLSVSFFFFYILRKEREEKLKMKMVEYRKYGIRGNGNGKYIFMFLKYTSCTVKHGQISFVLYV